MKSTFLMSLSDMVEHGLRGEQPAPRAVLVSKTFVLLGFVSVWAMAAWLTQLSRLFNPVFLPAPWTVLHYLVDATLTRQLETHIITTVHRIAVGFSIAAVVAISLGMLAGQVRCIRNMLEPIVEALRPVPPLALLPLFIVWVGIGETSKVAFITYATFFPMFITTLHAVMHVEPVLLRAAASLGASQRQLFLRVILPAALPDIFTGLRLGVALSFFVIVISEFIGAEHGLGYLINDGRNFFLVPQMLGAAVVLGCLGYSSNEVIRLLERRLLRWR